MGSSPIFRIIKLKRVKPYGLALFDFRSGSGPCPHGSKVSAPLRSLQNRRPPDVLQPIFRKALVVVAKLYGFRSKLHIRSEGEDKLMSQKKYSLLYPDTNAQYRTLSDMTMHDLGMDQICKKLSAKEREQNYIQNVMARMYADPAVTQYRCDIFEDVLRQKKCVMTLWKYLGVSAF